jgi:hypothetical protein
MSIIPTSFKIQAGPENKTARVRSQMRSDTGIIRVKKIDQENWELFHGETGYFTGEKGA